MKPTNDMTILQSLQTLETNGKCNFVLNLAIAIKQFEKFNFTFDLSWCYGGYIAHSDSKILKSYKISCQEFININIQSVAAR